MGAIQILRVEGLARNSSNSSGLEYSPSTGLCVGFRKKISGPSVVSTIRPSIWLTEAQGTPQAGAQSNLDRYTWQEVHKTILQISKALPIDGLASTRALFEF